MTQPQKSVRDDAWLGEAYYFWADLADADMWGRKSKRATGRYDIYTGEIDCENILNTVFNEEHYLFWLEKIEKVAKLITRKTLQKPTLKELNNYLKERADWNEVDGIMFQDLPANSYYSAVKPIRYKDKFVYFAYKKRVQLAVYNLKVLRNFVHLDNKECY